MFSRLASISSLYIISIPKLNSSFANGRGERRRQRGRWLWHLKSNFAARYYRVFCKVILGGHHKPLTYIIKKVSVMQAFKVFPCQTGPGIGASISAVHPGNLGEYGAIIGRNA